MVSLKYKIIKTAKQYNQYCKKLEELVDRKSRSRLLQNEIELLTVLIEKWDQDRNTFEDVDADKILRALMKERKMGSKDLSKLLNISSSEAADILTDKKTLSKKAMKKLSEHFKTSLETLDNCK
jgi:HTH-type transcriptional regulator/antitoxin HigA